MMTTSEATAGIGHNLPPEPTLPERLAATHAGLIANLEDLAKKASAQPKEIADDAQALTAAQIAADAGDILKKLEEGRKAANKPLLDEKAVNDAFFKPHTERAENIDRALMKRVTAYNNAKKAAADAAKLAAEEAERNKAAEAKAVAEQAMAAGRTDDAMAKLEEANTATQRADEVATAPPISATDATRITSETGLTLTTRTEWDFEITDLSKIDLEAIRSFIKPDHIETAIAAFVRINKGGRQIAGVRIFETQKAARRRR